MGVYVNLELYRPKYAKKHLDGKKKWAHSEKVFTTAQIKNKNQKQKPENKTESGINAI